MQETCMFDNEFTIARNGDAGWEGSIEVAGFIHYHNTITIPNDESWIIQGQIDSSTGLPVKLDARFKSGTGSDRSRANIVLRNLRISGQTAPLDTNVLPRNGMMSFRSTTNDKSFGGAFEYDGGSSDPSSPTKIAFVDVVFDHNSAESCGAVAIDARGSTPTPDRLSQFWDSAIDITMERVTFFRNWGMNIGGAFCVNNPW